MKYIIMCGGQYPQWETPRHLLELRGETIVERTIRLLRENGVTDIAISSNLPHFEGLGVPVLNHQNNYVCGKGGDWADAFYPIDEPACYIFGDVIFSPAAIKTIVDTQTDDVEFFASAPPFAPVYPKKYAEPFAFKVVDIEHFWSSIRLMKELHQAHRIKRGIAWELWQVIKNTTLNRIDYTNYTVINDYTCDVDWIDEKDDLTTRLKQYGFLLDEEK